MAKNHVKTVFPKMVKIRQHLERDHLENPSHILLHRLRKSGLLTSIKPGSHIAITAGSRGINHISAFLKTVVTEVKQAGGHPFIVPAMGSHGGATADGQVNVLKSLGITEKTVGAPLHSSMETVTLGKTTSGIPVFIDKCAYESDGIIVMNRVKLHTAYHGRVESGLCKMVAVGLGKHKGALTIHQYGLGNTIVECFRIARKKVPFICGIAILENAFDETLDMRVVPPGEFETVDSEFIERCRTILPRIPVDTFDILIVDEMGKNISGTGMDTNVIGFWRRFGGVKEPDYKTLIVRTLTSESQGNAVGIGLADLTTQELVNTIDFDVTYANAITSHWLLGRVPITLKNDLECLKVALSKHGIDSARVVRIKNTRDLAELWISENLLTTVRKRKDITIIGKPTPLSFTTRGILRE